MRLLRVTRQCSTLPGLNLGQVERTGTEVYRLQVGGLLPVLKSRGRVTRSTHLRFANQ